ncbi:metallophosphoesterase [Cryobacterium sp. 10S3]|uniref:metallophosphoesterase n=1 Tax=Cryobacterium sp. 10S3 TaxID=3048582 RepID=UPI002B23971F|nr:metallophosphoesterase [Cryobacterium sp. 10S3]MEB0287128.1 metallophosphoesterase [Cryobacterium sp. 10S3]
MNRQDLLRERASSSAAATPEDETHVVVAGDWHGSCDWVGKAIPSIARHTPSVRTILHVGDFGIWPGVGGQKFLDAVDFWCNRAGVSRVLVTPGNHENWGWLNGEFNAKPGKPVALSPVVVVLPRGYRFEIGKRNFASFGGAASVDFEMRSLGMDWFPEELPTSYDVERAISGGQADVLLTHETIDGGTPASEHMLRSNLMRWSPKSGSPDVTVGGFRAP